MASTVASSPTATFLIGRILVKENRKPIPNLLVALFDIDGWPDREHGGGNETENSEAARAAIDPARLLDSDLSLLDKQGKRLGSVLTDATGGFTLAVATRDLTLGKSTEQRPDLVLLVLAPDEPGLTPRKRLLHLSLDVRFNAAGNEAQLILLPTRLLKEHDIPFGDALPPDTGTARQRVDDYVSEFEHRATFDEGVTGYHGKAGARDQDARSSFRATVRAQLAPPLVHAPDRGVYVTDGKNLPEKHAEAVGASLGAANEKLDPPGQGGVPVNLYLTLSERDQLFGNATTGVLEIDGDSIDPLLFRKDAAAALFHHNPIAGYCSAQTEDEACALEHTGLSHGHPPAAPPPPPPEGASALSEADVLSYLDRLVREVPSPDAVLRPDLGKVREGKDVGTSVSTFSLQKGPAEVPAFHDFHVAQIAFNHVWQQLFDEGIPDLAYTANALGQSHFGVDGVFNRALLSGAMGLHLSQWITPVEVPAIIARFFDITRDEYNDLSATNRAALKSISDNIADCTGPAIALGNMTYKLVGSRITDLRMIQSLTEQGEHLIDAVRHDDYHTLHKTLRDLQERLTGKYEFTVFAATRDYHSVNFGLINTYRQLWEPVEYQAGNLIRTIPLAPGEKREYSVKVTRHEKRTAREARKNNTSITSEQVSTSRVEADIMAKAQTKTTFGLTSEGDVNVGAYSGKASTSFGVEAIGESAQNRKDFRESVLKAVQDYKNETTTEVSTESDWTSQTNESGAISNINEEVAVTYLFYELQKRYRLSERIYRTMPVVFVAQEVPSPDQITPAWVIANDWIINRVLLDDSFRPTLRYLASNSVGDDFSLRELRRNLRQQRNLVETLRIEYSAASQQADNRYAALESQISRRIAEEDAEERDGLLNDVADFFGRGQVLGGLFGSGGGPNPEAAKARELAAKDAHQYALEKAERASAGLKQEVNNLHQLTEQYNRALQARLDNETQVKRLLVHLRNNVLYYMQSIWQLEPPHQRTLRLHNVAVPVLKLASRGYRVTVAPDDDIFAAFRPEGTSRHRAFMHGTLEHLPGGGFQTQPLSQVADLDTVVYCMGNYLAFAMNEHNALTEFMAAPYIDAAFGAMDPDDLSNISLDQYSRYVCCLRHRLTEAEFQDITPTLVKWLGKLLASPLRNGDEIVVPTGSLFIESLVDPNPVLERFKLQHRELDVYKVQEEVRGAALENLRLAARLLNHEREDPTIEKKIVIEGAPGAVVVPPEA